MRESRELEKAGQVAGAVSGQRPERRRPQVEVIREPNEVDESELPDPKPAE